GCVGVGAAGSSGLFESLARVASDRGPVRRQPRGDGGCQGQNGAVGLYQRIYRERQVVGTNATGDRSQRQGRLPGASGGKVRMSRTRSAEAGGLQIIVRLDDLDQPVLG